MQVSNFVIITALEVYILLILISVFFIYHSRNQRNLIRRQQEKLRELVQNVSSNHADKFDAPDPLAVYKDELRRQLEQTLTRYKAMSPKADINELSVSETPNSEKVLSLRYKFLSAENTATTLNDGHITVDWTLLEEQLEILLTPPAPSNDIAALQEELDVNKKRIENLEKFKQLFFDLEKQWQEAKQNADQHYSQLANMADSVDDKAYFNDVLERYHNVYNEVNESVALGRDLEKHPATIAYQTIRINRTDPNTAKEIIKLRNVAADQHRIINQLHRKLEDATTTAEREEAVNELQHQLERQTRFVKEAETCVQLLEDELARSHDKITQQELALAQAKDSDEEKERIKEQLHNFALESKDLMKTINELELQNAQSIPGQKDVNNANADDLKKVKDDYLALQSRYAELEEKYLEIKLGK